MLGRREGVTLHARYVWSQVALGADIGANHTFLARVAAAADAADVAVTRLLWHNSSNSSSYFAAGWHGPTGRPGHDNMSVTPPLLTDSLYGALWASLLGLDQLGATRAQLLTHLRSE